MVLGMDCLRRRLTSATAAALLVAPLAVWSACRPADAARGRDTDPVDRPLARDVALAEFRAGVPEPAGLSGGAPSRAALIAAFAGALARRDTAALGRLLLSRAEFAWLYYPTDPQGLPPYDLSPGLRWFTLRGSSDQGLRRLLEKRAGWDLKVAGVTCDPAVSHEGENTVTGPCVVHRLTAAGDTVSERLFGLLIERGGVHKFVSYANHL